MSEIAPFRIHVPEAVLADLRERLARTRFVDVRPGGGWEDGLDPAFLRELVAHWRDAFDWRREEAALNAFPQITARVGDLRMHAVHRRSAAAGALPIVVLHGWPGSVAELRHVIEPLADPAAHGGDAADAFHVVAPSLPGYGFSEAPRARGFDVRAVAGAVAGLMERLGYARYAVQGGDWGAMAGSHLALLHPERVVGLHLNMVLAPRPRDEGPEAMTPGERADVDAARRYLRTQAAYQAVQTLEPDLVAQALTDSPAGLAAWIVSKFRAWSDCGGDPRTRFRVDDLLTNVMLYWVTGTVGSSMRLYRESLLAGTFGPIPSRVEVPTGCAIFPREIFRPPRRWAERLYRIERWTPMPEGGHFAALEVPDLLVQDVRAFFRGLRARG